MNIPENDRNNNFRRPLKLRKVSKRSNSKDSNKNEKQIMRINKNSSRSISRKIQENLEQIIKKEVEYRANIIKHELEDNLKAVKRENEESKISQKEENTIIHLNQRLLSQIICDVILSYLFFGAIGLFMIKIGSELPIENRAIYLMTGFAQIILLFFTFSNCSINQWPLVIILNYLISLAFMINFFFLKL